MKRIRPIFISYNPHRSPAAQLRSKSKAGSMVDVAAHAQSERQIIVALGFITTLLLLSGIQLYRCVNNNPSKAKAIAPKRTLTFDLNRNPSIAPSVELNSWADSQKTEMSAIQNTISHGKF